MPAAAVPKTSVHENRELFATEYEVRFPRKLLISTPASNSTRTKNCNQLEFRVLVSLGLDGSHYLRALNFVEHVGHTILQDNSRPRCLTSGFLLSERQEPTRVASKAQPLLDLQAPNLAN